MKISIIVPIYNSSKYLRKCLDSIINQTYKNLEIILIDDNSSDNSYDICLEYRKNDNRIKLIKTKVNKGVSVTRNIGIKNVTSNYLTFVDSDDYVDLDYVETLYNLIQEGDYDVSIVGYKKIINNQEYFLFKEEKLILNREEAFKFLFKDNNFTTGVVCKLYKKELFDNIKFPKNKIYEDIEVVGKILLNVNKVIYHSVSKYNYVIRYGSLSFSSYTDRELTRIKHSKELIDRVINLYPNLKKYANIFYLNNLIAVCNKQLFINIYKSDIIKLTKKVIKDNIISILTSNISFIKKIQILLFLMNVKLYKLIYRLFKKEEFVYEDN
ncbi:MAG: glycosyltransferase family 2 protein [Bacilli bacterium]|nr:glycosyltransferase family 2 protein [Bacilli bacterium]